QAPPSDLTNHYGGLASCSPSRQAILARSVGRFSKAKRVSVLKTLPSGAGEPGKNSAEVRLRAVQELGQPGAPPPSGGGVHVLPIIGQIEGHVLLPVKNKTTKYEHVIPQLVA